ncbi:hypothetical protein BCAR13_860025 [Paraburkholderia caribensis]|nr:hypothetical protein BCAR13_860025 [Paraburkholderia caribensis]
MRRDNAFYAGRIGVREVNRFLQALRKMGGVRAGRGCPGLQAHWKCAPVFLRHCAGCAEENAGCML